MEVFQRGTPKRNLQGWLGYLGALTWSLWHGDAMMEGDVMWRLGRAAKRASMARQGGVTGGANRGLAAGRPWPDPPCNMTQCHASISALHSTPLGWVMLGGGNNVKYNQTLNIPF